MATYKYKNPNQQEVSLDLPDEGEIFRNPNDPLQGEIFKRQGQALLRLGEQQFRGANNASVRLGNILPQYGINFGSIREVSPESLDILQNKLGYTFRPGQISDFQSSNPQNIGESYRQGIDPNNPNQGNITSNTGAVSRFTPSPITTTGEISGMGKMEPLGNQQAPSGFSMQDRNSQIQALQSGINTTANNLRHTSQQRGVGLVPQFTQQFEGQSTLPPILPQTGTPQPTMTGTPGMAGAGSPTTGQSLQDQFFQTLIDQMKPTSEETALKDKQTSLDTQLRNLNQGQGVMNANIEDQPIALPFITGQQSAVEKRYALQRGDVANQQMTVQQKLANEIAKRQSSVDISKAQLEYQQGKEKIAREGAFSLSEGQNRYDIGGKLIATGAQKPVTKLDTSTVEAGGRRLLVNNQTGATIKDLGAVTRISNPILDELREFDLRQKTESTPGQVVNASTGAPAKLTDTQSQFLSQGSVLRELNQEVKNAVIDIGTEALKGWTTERGYLIPVVQKKYVNDPAVLDLMQKMYALNNLFVYFSTGKQLNETEFDRLAKQTPNFKATTEYNNKALINFENNIKSRMNNYLKFNGWKIRGEVQDTLGQTSGGNTYTIK